MKGAHIGELEELVLLVIGSLTDNAYAIRILEEIQRHSNRNLDVTSIHSVLRRLEKKGLVSSEMRGATQERGGRRKRFFALTREGRLALDETMSVRQALYQKLPRLTYALV